MTELLTIQDLRQGEAKTYTLYKQTMTLSAWRQNDLSIAVLKVYHTLVYPFSGVGCRSARLRFSQGGDPTFTFKKLNNVWLKSKISLTRKKCVCPIEFENLSGFYGTTNNVNKQIFFGRFVPVFKGTTVCKFLQALVGQSGYVKHNFLVYTNEDRNYFPTNLDLAP